MGSSALILVELGERGRLPRWVPEILCAALGVAAVIGSIVVAEAAG